MVNIEKELMNFDYREIELDLKDLFPEIDLEDVKKSFSSLVSDDPHQTVFNIAEELWNGGYSEVLEKHSFWDGRYKRFTGHCHQCTPILGLVLKALGFKTSYLECFRIKESFLETGKIEKISPEEEPNPEMKSEFLRIQRIPYCCLEVEINGEKFYLTGKHLKPVDGITKALLSPSCYREFIGVFPHQSDKTKSGIYLKKVKPKENPGSLDFDRQIIWTKQTERDPSPEVFVTFLRMNL